MCSRFHFVTCVLLWIELGDVLASTQRTAQADRQHSHWLAVKCIASAYPSAIKNDGNTFGVMPSVPTSPTVAGVVAWTRTCERCDVDSADDFDDARRRTLLPPSKGRCC